MQGSASEVDTPAQPAPPAEGVKLAVCDLTATCITVHSLFQVFAPKIMVDLGGGSVVACRSRMPSVAIRTALEEQVGI